MLEKPHLNAKVQAWRGAFGRLCVLGAQALKADHGPSRDAVRIALSGHGENIQLRHIREARILANERMREAVSALTLGGMGRVEALKTCSDVAHEARKAVESEYGHDFAPGDEKSPWQHLNLPLLAEAH